MKVTEDPAQIGLAEAEILTLADKIGLTVTVMEGDVAGEPAKHGVAFEVITTETTSLFNNEFDVNVGLFVPTAVEPTYH